MKRITEITQAYDGRKEGYGQHCCDLRMVIVGDKGAVQFVLYTAWYLDQSVGLKPLPADLGYHSPKPMYEDQEPIEDNCKYINGPCYYDGSSLAAHEIYKELLEHGSDRVWCLLEEYYREVFGD